MILKEWERLINAIVRERRLTNVAYNHSCRVNDNTIDLKREFVLRLWKSMPSFEFAKGLIAGTESSYPRSITEFVVLDDKLLLEYIQRHDPGLKKFSDIAYYEEKSRWEGEKCIRYIIIKLHRTHFSSDNYTKNWNFYKHFVKIRHQGCIYEPKEILKGLKETSKEMYDSLRSDINAYRRILRADINIAKPSPVNVVTGNFKQTTATVRQKIGDKIKLYSDALKQGNK